MPETTVHSFWYLPLRSRWYFQVSKSSQEFPSVLWYSDLDIVVKITCRWSNNFRYFTTLVYICSCRVAGGRRADIFWTPGWHHKRMSSGRSWPCAAQRLVGSMSHPWFDTVWTPEVPFSTSVLDLGSPTSNEGQVCHFLSVLYNASTWTFAQIDYTPNYDLAPSISNFLLACT